MNIKIPSEVKYIIDTLENSGYEAYAVGGCVRDSLLGKEPQDWDICTSALPKQTMVCFDGEHIIETGLKHGTITLMLNHIPLEITTYRVDGKYTDNRRPDNVKFVNVLKRDLARRDFTVNAMAYNPKTGIVDYYGGHQDLTEKKIKCVGNADKRFKEDALRIMRALRFAGTFGFAIEEDTAKAMFDNRKLLQNIAAERIAVELNKIIMGDNICELLFPHLPVIFEIIPELEKASGFEQNTPYHCYDVLTHILKSVDAAPKNIVIRLIMLFHDIGKPECYTEDDSDIGHFYGHPKISCDIAKKILLRLKYDSDTIKAVTELILYHDQIINLDSKHIKRWLNKIGEERFMQLIEVKRADVKAQSIEYHSQRLRILDEISVLAKEVIELGQCFSLKDLTVNGNDLISAGIKEGTEIGVALNMLVEMVIDEKVENEKTALLKMIIEKE